MLFLLFDFLQGHSTLLPGRCWPFPGDQGHLVIGLPFPVVISHVSLGHISNSSSPSGTIDAAPKVFSIYVRFYGLFIYGFNTLGYATILYCTTIITPTRQFLR